MEMFCTFSSEKKWVESYFKIELRFQKDYVLGQRVAAARFSLKLLLPDLEVWRTELTGVGGVIWVTVLLRAWYF